MEGKLVKCFYLVETGQPGTLRVGFTVPSRVYHAVRRNRLRRLMRESFRQCRKGLITALELQGLSAALIFHFKGDEEVQVSRLRIHPVAADFQSLCDRLIGRLGSRNS